MFVTPCCENNITKCVNILYRVHLLDVSRLFHLQFQIFYTFSITAKYCIKSNNYWSVWCKLKSTQTILYTWQHTYLRLHFPGNSMTFRMKKIITPQAAVRLRKEVQTLPLLSEAHPFRHIRVEVTHFISCVWNTAEYYSPKTAASLWGCIVCVSISKLYWPCLCVCWVRMRKLWPLLSEPYSEQQYDVHWPRNGPHSSHLLRLWMNQHRAAIVEKESRSRRTTI